MKPVFMQNRAYEDTGMSKLLTSPTRTSLHDFDARNETKYSSIENSFKCEKFLTTTVQEEIKLFVLEKVKFQYRSNSAILAFMDLSDYEGFHARIKFNKSLIKNLSTKNIVFD